MRKMTSQMAESSSQISRRLLLWAAGATALAGGILGALGGLRLFLPLASKRPPVAAGRPLDFPLHVARQLPSLPVFILREERGLAALSARCPHLGCAVEQRADGFVCFCHGSRFTARGERIAGAAPRGLRWLRLTAARGLVFVDLDEEVPVGTFLEVDGV
jgi:nitrite reductase/ring-hydroxylating ferredoxin subunit